MNLHNMLAGPWAILPKALEEMDAIYARHLGGETVDIAAIEARLGAPLDNKQPQLQMSANGVAILELSGVLAPKANLFARVSGATSLQMVSDKLAAAVADPKVRAVLLAIDSPGGEVFGTAELAAQIRGATQQKPIVAVSDGTMASAAYWIGSAASQAYITGPVVAVGSIGVVARHNYSPRRDGGITSEVVAGKFKRMASDTQPLDQSGRDYLQAQVDYLYGVFVGAVADHRGTDAKTVHDKMADGRIFTGKQAVDAGLVDGIESMSSIVDRLGSNPGQFKGRASGGQAPSSNGARAVSGVYAAQEQAQSLSREIQRVQREAQARGRQISPVQALAELQAAGGAKSFQ